MRSRHLYGIMLAALAAVAVGGAGCDNETNPTSTGGNGGEGGGAMGVDKDGNANCGEAVPYVLGSMDDLAGKLDPVSSDRDYYKVDLKKGQAIFLGANSKPDTDPYGQTFPDAVLTLYAPDGKTQLARNDDGSSSNNSELLYLVPQDGTYCLEVSECFAVFGADVCSAPDLIKTFDYTFGGFEINPAAALVTVDAEPNETPAEATTTNLVRFPDAPEPILGYQSLAWGSFSSATDKDTFSFVTQNDFQVEADGRALCVFNFYQASIEGNGSTAEMNVLAEVATKAAPNAIIASTNVQLWDYTFGYPEMPTLTMPCNKGTEYVLTLSRAAGATAGSHDFYFFDHYQYSSNTKEIEPNDASAQPIQTSPSEDGKTHFASITGDILKAGEGGDIDTFEFNVPAGVGLASAICSAQRDGSGLRGLFVSLLDNNGNFLQNGSGFEGEDHIVYVDNAFVPPGTTSITVTIEADEQDPAVSGNYYNCTFILTPG
jgi:Bacterial pre-peptidase C-terminal domain